MSAEDRLHGKRQVCPAHHGSGCSYNSRVLTGDENDPVGQVGLPLDLLSERDKLNLEGGDCANH